MQLLRLVDGVVIDKGHPIAAGAVIVIVGHVHWVIQGERASLTLHRLSLGICAPGEEVQGRRFCKDGGMDLERGRSTGVLGEEIDVGIAMIVP